MWFVPWYFFYVWYPFIYCEYSTIFDKYELYTTVLYGTFWLNIDEIKDIVWHRTVHEKKSLVNIIKTKIVKKIRVQIFFILFFPIFALFFNFNLQLRTYIWYVKTHLQAINKQQYLYDITTAISNYQWPLVHTFFYEKIFVKSCWG